MIDIHKRIDAIEFAMNTCRYNWRRFPVHERPPKERLQSCARSRRAIARWRKKGERHEVVMQESLL